MYEDYKNIYVFLLACQWLLEYVPKQRKLSDEN
jgi:hypothetical protein